MNTYKHQGNRGLLDEENTLEKLSKMEDPLQRMSSVVDFEMFRDVLESHLLSTNKKSNAGARPFDVVLMFKIMILQRYYGLGDRQTEYQILDRASFKRFLGLESGDKVPDEKTIRAFREKLTKKDAVEELFALFHQHLETEGLIINEGKIVDASFVIAPRQRNSKEENRRIKEGEGQELWQDTPHKKSHKDVDARWTKKNKETFYGYKNHAKVDGRSKLADFYVVTDASVHGSQALAALIGPEDRPQPLYADSAYSGEPLKKAIRQRGMKNQVMEKGFKNKPLTGNQQKRNHRKSKTRARVEHVFGFMEQSMYGLLVKSIGIIRARATIGLINLTYSLCRFEQIFRLNILPIKQ